jgi:DNA-binding GntR family transcriptional regulator
VLDAMSTRRPVNRAMTAQHAALIGLREQIRAGELAPGQRIDQRRAAEELECSIVPVREALKTLEAEGQVSYSPQRGYFVAALDADELLEIYRIRELLEEEAVRTAVPRIDPAAMRVLNILLDECEEAAAAGLVPELIAADRRLHLTLYAASGMTRLVGLLRMLWDSTDRYRAQYYADTSHLQRVRDEHRAIVAAVADHDADEAIRLLAVHRGHAIDSVRRLLESEAKPASRDGR